MAWNRKTTNSSTFVTPDGSSSASLTPGFTLWTPSANLTEKVWELGSLWTANTANDGSYLKFKYNNVDLFTVTQSGFETPKTRSTTLVALPDIADASYLAGDIVNYNGILYIKEA